MWYSYEWSYGIKTFRQISYFDIWLSNISGTILYSDLAKDDTDSVKPLVQHVRDTFGEPIGVVSDMQNSIIKSVEAVFPCTGVLLCKVLRVALR
jgi:hypothetical protein